MVWIQQLTKLKSSRFTFYGSGISGTWMASTTAAVAFEILSSYLELAAWAKVPLLNKCDCSNGLTCLFLSLRDGSIMDLKSNYGSLVFLLLYFVPNVFKDYAKKKIIYVEFCRKRYLSMAKSLDEFFVYHFPITYKTNGNNWTILFY